MQRNDQCISLILEKKMEHFIVLQLFLLSTKLSFHGWEPQALRSGNSVTLMPRPLQIMAKMSTLHRMSTTSTSPG